MQKKKIIALMLAFTCVTSALTGCGNSDSAADSSSEPKNGSGHESITIMTPFRYAGGLIDILKEKYPEVNLEIIPYSGKNSTAFMLEQLKGGDMPDIYCTNVYSPGQEDLSDKLIDLSGYAFTDNYQEARLRDVTDNGAIYLLPSYYTCIGIIYNKTLLEKNGWELPKSFKELEELAPKVEEAGYQLSLAQAELPGYGFQYMCNILDTDYLNTPDGRQWQNDFLDGKTTLAGNEEMKESFSTLQKWRDLGMLNPNLDSEGNITTDKETKRKFAEGNTLFLLGSSNTFSEEETSDEMGIMPYLSEDGSSNAYILSVSRYVGLNKELEKKGNEQKLEDALHVMEVLSSIEGMQTLNRQYADTSLLPLKDYEVKSDGMYAEAEDDLNNGYTAPFIYNGWENMIVPVGESVQAFMTGKKDLNEVIKDFDESQSLLKDNASQIYTTVTETLDTKTCADLIGIAFAQAADADVALISMNKWYKDDEDLNNDGVSGMLYPVQVTDQEITAILPTGWKGNIQTVTLTGKRIKELVESGYLKGGNSYPYELVTKEGFKLADDTTYTVAICGLTDEVAEEGQVQDTGILGLKVVEDYMGQFDKLSSADITWK